MCFVVIFLGEIPINKVALLMIQIIGGGTVYIAGAKAFKQDRDEHLKYIKAIYLDDVY